MRSECLVNMVSTNLYFDTQAFIYKYSNHAYLAKCRVNAAPLTVIDAPGIRSIVAERPNI